MLPQVVRGLMDDSQLHMSDGIDARGEAYQAYMFCVKTTNL